MRHFLALTAFLAVAASAPAAAQMYPGEEVTVNPGATGTQVLLYPGGKYVRIVPPLRQPGEAARPSRLHLPARHRLARTRQRPAIEAAEAPVARVARPAPRTVPPADFSDVAVVRPVAPAPARIESTPKPAPVRAPPQRVVPAEPPVQRMTSVEPKPARTPPQRVVPAEPPVQRMASVEPPPARTPPPMRNPEAGAGSKRGVILFAPNATDPSVTALESVKSLAGSLSMALAEGTSRVQLLAYGGQRGNKSSDTRRLSLKRALIVRQILIDSGVPSERIDVRALGGADDKGPLDRVDVFLRS